MKKGSVTNKNQEFLPFRMHPRVFAALGDKLVTSDVVAIMELVKNSYDAFATRVDVCIKTNDKSGESYIEVSDNGQGMDRQIIEDVWAVVATPHREKSPIARKGKKTRRVTGKKGLGRLSTARLGDHLTMLTAQKDSPVISVDVDWDAIARADDIDACKMTIAELAQTEDLKGPGTIVRISKLKSNWDVSNEDVCKKIASLKSRLTRFVPPFESLDDFEIWITSGDGEATPTMVESTGFVDHPPYSISGSVNEYGILEAAYRYRRQSDSRVEHVRYDLLNDKRLTDKQAPDESTQSKSDCGGFTFDLRAWDLQKDKLLELSERFNLSEKWIEVREHIVEHPYNGISLYRDGILILPKTDDTKDWLKLDLRRVSRLGKRMSTNQFIGVIHTSSKGNANLEDKSDRESLTSNVASQELNRFMSLIIDILEKARSEDREEPDYKEPPFSDLLNEIRDEEFPVTIRKLAKRDAPWNEVLSATESHTNRVQKAARKIEQRLTYYSRLASLGTLAAILQHEIGNHTGTIDRFFGKITEHLKIVGKTVQPLLQLLERSVSSLRTLQRLSHTFAPLSNVTKTTRRRDTNLKKAVTETIEMLEKEIAKAHIKVSNNCEDCIIAVDPGETIAVIFNLLANSIYWLMKVEKDHRVLEITCKVKDNRVFAYVHDSGPGIDPGDEERVFWPGVTKKPNGIGMGLTVASELVAQYGGHMHLIQPGEKDGASFGFDLPLAGSKK